MWAEPSMSRAKSVTSGSVAVRRQANPVALYAGRRVFFVAEVGRSGWPRTDPSRSHDDDLLEAVRTGTILLLRSLQGS